MPTLPVTGHELCANLAKRRQVCDDGTLRQHCTVRTLTRPMIVRAHAMRVSLMYTLPTLKKLVLSSRVLRSR